MQAAAPIMQTPSATKTNQSITINWNVFNGNQNNRINNVNSGYTYELYWNNGQTNQNGIAW